MEALDPKNTVWGIIIPNRSISSGFWETMQNSFFGEVVPIFLDMDKFR